MIVAASTTLLADSQSGRRGGALTWALLVADSVASLAANVAVAEPTVIGRVIAGLAELCFDRFLRTAHPAGTRRRGRHWGEAGTLSLTSSYTRGAH
jgi:hypothetical protein